MDSNFNPNVKHDFSRDPYVHTFSSNEGLQATTEEGEEGDVHIQIDQNSEEKSRKLSKDRSKSPQSNKLTLNEVLTRQLTGGARSPIISDQEKEFTEADLKFFRSSQDNRRTGKKRMDLIAADQRRRQAKFI